MEDLELQNLLQAEELRQKTTLNLIASENFAPRSVREIGASALTNKYTEGYPGNRYYAGCSVFDQIEEMAERRACQLFNASWANVQPHSGASANNAVFQALLEPGDSLLGLALDHGGHLSHGMKLNVSGTFYQPHAYHLQGKTINMEEVAELAGRLRPKLIIAGWSAYGETLDFPRFRQIADSTGSLLLVDMSHFAGLVAGGKYPNPLPWADVVTTTTHKTLRGPRGGIILSSKPKFKDAVRRAVFPGQQGGALPQTIAAKAHALWLAAKPEWSEYARALIQNAAALSESLEEAGFRIVSGQKTHQVLLDLEGRSGKEAEETLEKNDIVCNRNTVPGSKRPAADPGGLRFGSPPLTTRHMGPEEFREIGNLISRALQGQDVRSDVGTLLKRFPPVP